MNRHLKILLAVSLVANLFFAGLLCGHTLHRFLGADSFHMIHGELLSQLPPDKQKLFKNAMHEVWLDTKSIREQMADAKKEARHLLQADPLDESAYLTQVQHINDLHAQIKRRIAQATAAIAKQFTADERAILADIISRPPPPDREPPEAKDDKD